jgi:hypothetical protein
LGSLGSLGSLGILGILGIENRKLKIVFFASARTRFLPRPRTVKTRLRVKPRPRGKRGRVRTSGRKGRPDGNFPPISSFMTSLATTRYYIWKYPLQGFCNVTHPENSGEKYNQCIGKKGELGINWSFSILIAQASEAI